MSCDQTARVNHVCNDCKECIYIGERITKTNSNILADMSTNKVLPEILVEIISQICGEEQKVYHSECANVNSYKTSSGRNSRKPVKYEDEVFIKGSGFGGCDHYDLDFDGNLKPRTQVFGLKYGQNLKDFVIEDDEPLPPKELIESDEDEWESGDETDYEDEPDEWD